MMTQAERSLSSNVGVGGLSGQMADVASDGLCAFDREFRVLCCNRSLEKITGWSRAFIMGQDLFTILPFLRQPGFESRLSSIFQGNSINFLATSFSFPNSKREGECVIRCYPGQDGEALPDTGLLVFQDMTEMGHSRARLAETEKRFCVMADCAPVLLWMSGKDAECNFFNQSWFTVVRSDFLTFGHPFAEQQSVGVSAVAV